VEFLSAAQQACYERIGPWLQEAFGPDVAADPTAPLFVLRIGSGVTGIAASAWGDGEVFVCAFSTVVRGAELTRELLKDLLEENRRARIGAFSLTDKGDIVFEHSIVGSTCDKHELLWTVREVARMADQFDDQIVSRWGGLRTAD
jgi:hypothetical protein